MIFFGFFAIRAFSFLTRNLPYIQTAVAGMILLFFLFLALFRQEFAWIVLISELLLDGNGHFFSFLGIALRSVMIGLFLIVWFGTHIVRRTDLRQFAPQRRYAVPLILIFASAIAGCAVGIARNHPHAALEDLAPFLFLFLIFPAKEFFILTFASTKKNFRGFIAGSFCFSVGTLLLFSSGFAKLQGPYYHWFRDIAGGKITDMGFNLFRIVLPEHILLIFFLPMLIAEIALSSQRFLRWLVVQFAGLTLMLNISRTYILASATAIGTLFFFLPKKHWFAVTLSSIAGFAILFPVLCRMASRGQISGFELYASRFAGIAHSSTEESAATRSELLRPIMAKIRAHPIFGSGFGSSITYVDQKTREEKTTRQFDWGYLEIWVKMGTVGLLSAFALITVLMRDAIKQKNAGIATGLASIVIATVTMPALFHVFGIFYLIFCITMLSQNDLPRGVIRAHSSFDSGQSSPRISICERWQPFAHATAMRNDAEQIFINPNA